MKPDFFSSADEIAKPRPDMNIKIADFTLSEKSINIYGYISGATGGVKKEPDNKEKHVRLDSVKGDSHTRNSPTNPMSYSVPNLPASMDNLLETFAAVARRNAGNNMLRSANAVSLARLLPPNSSSKFIFC